MPYTPKESTLAQKIQSEKEEVSATGNTALLTRISAGRLLEEHVLMWLMTVWIWACGLGLRVLHVSTDEQCAPTKPKTQHRHNKPENRPPSGHHKLSDTDIVENHGEAPHGNTDQSTALGISRSSVFNCAQDLMLLDDFQFGRKRQEPRTGQIHRTCAPLRFETRQKTSAPHSREEKPYIPEDLANKLARMFEGISHTMNPRPIFTEGYSTGITGSTASNRLQIMALKENSPNDANQNTLKNGTNLYLVKWKSIATAVSGFVLLQTRREIANTGISEPRKSGKIRGRLESSGEILRTFQDRQHRTTNQDAESWKEFEMMWERDMCRASPISFPPIKSLRIKNLPFTQNESASRIRKEEALRAVPSPSQIEQQNCYKEGEASSTDPTTRKNPKNSRANNEGTRFEIYATSKTDGIPRLNRTAGASWTLPIRLAEAWKAKTELEISPTTIKHAEIIQGVRDLTVIRVKQEWRWRATCVRASRSSGTEGTWSGDERPSNNSALKLNAEIAAAQSKHNIFRPKTGWRILEDTRYEIGPTRLRCNEAEHRHRPTAANEPRIEIKRHQDSGEQFQYPINDIRNFDQTKLTNELISTMTNLPPSSKPAEHAPGKRCTSSSRGRFTHHPPRLNPNPRPLPSTLRAPPDPRLLPSAAPTVRIHVPTPCRALGRRRAGELGPADYFPREPNAERRMTAVAQGQTARYYQGLALTARPGTLSSPQTVYTGEEHRPGGQEIHHAILLNARMLIHNPQTGIPAERTGHAEVRLFATPDDDSRWNLEVPFPADEDVAAALVKYEPLRRSEVSAHQREGRYVLTMDRTLAKVDSGANGNEAPDPTPDAAVPWRRTILPIPKAALRRIAAAAAAAKAAEVSLVESSQDQDEPMADVTRNGPEPEPMDTGAAPAFQATGVSRAHTLRFLLRPVNQPPEEGANGLVRLGNAAEGGDDVFAVNAIPRNGGPRCDTPHPPLRLYDSPPALKSIAKGAMDENDGGDAMEGVERTGKSRPAPAAAPAVTMPVKGQSNHALERLNYNSRKCFVGAPAAASSGALVFGAFIGTAPPSPTTSSAATDADSSPESDMDEDVARSLVIPPARPPTAIDDASEQQVQSNASKLAALDLETPRPPLLALASANLGNAHSELAAPVLAKALTTAPVTMAGQRALSPIDFDDAELVSTSSGEEGEVKEKGSAPGAPQPSRAARLAIPQLGNGKRGPVVTRDRFSSSPSFESKPRVVTPLEENETGSTIRLREACVVQRTRPAGDHHEMYSRPPQNGQTSWVRISAVRASLKPEELLNPDVEQSSSSDEDSIPALVSPSDSESSNNSESNVSSEPRVDPVVDNQGRSQTVPSTNDTVLAGGTLVRELGYLLDRYTLAPPAPEVDDNSRGVLLAQSLRVAIEHNGNNRTRRITEDNYVGQPLRDAFEIAFTHARLVLDQPAMATHHEPIDLEERAREYQEVIRRNVGVASLVRTSITGRNQGTHQNWQTQFTAATLCKVAVPVVGGCFRVAERWATPRTPEGAAFRVFSDWARAQGDVFMSGIGLEVARRPGFVAVLTMLKICGLEFIRRVFLILRHYGGDLDESILHSPANLPLPMFNGDQNSQFRMVTHALAVMGRGTLAKLASDFMGLRFREQHLISFMNYSGMLEPVGPDADDFEARAMIAESALNITRASANSNPPSSRAELPFQLTRRNGRDRPVHTQAAAAARDAPTSRSASSHSAPTRSATPRPSSIPAPRVYHPHMRGHARNPLPIPRPLFTRVPLPPRSSASALATRE
ncbi:hypothetical protein C8R47DRAFT_1204327 [Mycena vitilis]|nr:hypothetical protein C8R47DRAFT_1204327 [Mycena vitilis]